MTTQKFSKGQFVTYRPGFGTASFLVKARVTRVHRDKSVDVQAFFSLDESGKPIPGFLGYHYRGLQPTSLSPA